MSSVPAVVRRTTLAGAMAVIAGLLCLPTTAFAAAPPARATVKPSLYQQAVRWHAAAAAAPRAAKPAPRAGLAQPLAATGSALTQSSVTTMCGSRPSVGTPPGGAPYETWSRYVGGTTDLYQMGYDQGCSSDQQRGSNSSLYQIAILNFGDPTIGSSGAFGATDKAGFHYIGNTGLTNSIEWSAVRYMLGFWDGTVVASGSFMTVMVGTNNHKYDQYGNDNGAPVNYAHGQAWARMVRDLQNWISNFGFGTQLAVEAADDMETSWAYYSQTLDWANGFSSVGGEYYDYGDAGGCPAYSSGNCNAGPLNGGNMGWSTANEYTISWALTPAYAVPEIYIPIQAQQWYQISLWGATHSHPRIYFTAALSEYNACGGCDNTYYQSWSQMQNAVNGDSRTNIGRIPYTTEMSYSNP